MKINPKKPTYTDILEAAQKGGLNELDWEQVDPKDINKPDENGLTPFQAAVMEKRADEIPEKFHNKESLLSTHQGKTAIEWAIEKKSMDQLSNLSTEVLMSKTEDKGNHFHKLAENEQLKNLDQTLITREALITQNPQGDTPTHINLTNTGHFPPGFFEKAKPDDIYNIQNREGHTIARNALLHEAAEEIPEAFQRRDGPKQKNKEPDQDVEFADAKKRKTVQEELKEEVHKPSNRTFDPQLLENSQKFVKEKQTQRTSNCLLSALKANPASTIKELKDNIKPDNIAREERKRDLNTMGKMCKQRPSKNTVFHVPGINNPETLYPEWLKQQSNSLSKQEREQISGVARTIEFDRLKELSKISDNLQTGDLKNLMKSASASSRDLQTNWQSCIENQKSEFLEFAHSAASLWSTDDPIEQEKHLSTITKADNPQTKKIFQTVEQLRDDGERSEALKELSRKLAESDDPTEQKFEREALVLLCQDEFKGDKNHPEYDEQRYKHAMLHSPLVHKYATLDEDEFGNKTNFEKKEFWKNINDSLEKDIKTPEGALQMLAAGQSIVSKENADDALIEIRNKNMMQQDEIKKDTDQERYLKQQKAQSIAQTSREMTGSMERMVGEIGKSLSESERGIEI